MYSSVKLYLRKASSVSFVVYDFYLTAAFHKGHSSGIKKKKTWNL